MLPDLRSRRGRDFLKIGLLGDNARQLTLEFVNVRAGPRQNLRQRDLFLRRGGRRRKTGKREKRQSEDLHWLRTCYDLTS